MPSTGPGTTPTGHRGAPRTRRPHALVAAVRRVYREIAKFGAVGALGFLVNVAVFNFCIRTLDLAPVRSGILATAVAIGTNYLGNRYWTYRTRDKHRVRRELSLFLLFSAVGMVIENGVLALSHYGMGFTSPLADNIAKNVVGLGLGTVFRFWSYRTWVFLGPPDDDGSGRPRLVSLSAQEEREDRRELLQ